MPDWSNYTVPLSGSRTVFRTFKMFKTHWRMSLLNNLNILNTVQMTAKDDPTPGKSAP
jgi:hypothetical protein